MAPRTPLRKVVLVAVGYGVSCPVADCCACFSALQTVCSKRIPTLLKQWPPFCTMTRC